MATAAVVGLLDWSVLHALSWLTAGVVFGSVILPFLYRRSAAFLDRHENLFVGVIFGWALGLGPPVGGFFGALVPVIVGLPVTSLEGAVLGLLVGPLAAAVEGLMITSAICLVVWGVTGQRRDRE
ncbi:MAG: hypothetical protein WD847_06425 [Pirellulales bacterium]